MCFSYEYAWPFVKCTYSTYSMLLKILPFALSADFRYIVLARTPQKTSVILRVLSLPRKQRVHKLFPSNGCMYCRLFT
jgi:hypothetical protein